MKSELPQSITLAESPYGCMDSKLEVAYMKDGRFYVFARDASWHLLLASVLQAAS